MFMHTNREEIEIYPRTTVGWVSWISCSHPHAWCHQIQLKIQEYGQITVILAANIIPICARYIKTKSLVSERSIWF